MKQKTNFNLSVGEFGNKKFMKIFKAQKNKLEIKELESNEIIFNDNDNIGSISSEDISSSTKYTSVRDMLHQKYDSKKNNETKRYEKNITEKKSLKEKIEDNKKRGENCSSRIYENRDLSNISNNYKNGSSRVRNLIFFFENLNK